MLPSSGPMGSDKMQGPPHMMMWAPPGYRMTPYPPMQMQYFVPGPESFGPVMPPRRSISPDRFDSLVPTLLLLLTPFSRGQPGTPPSPGSFVDGPPPMYFQGIPPGLPGGARLLPVGGPMPYPAMRPTGGRPPGAPGGPVGVPAARPPLDRPTMPRSPQGMSPLSEDPDFLS